MSFPPHMPMMPPMPFFPPVAPMMMPPSMGTPPPSGIPNPTNGTHRTGENEKKNRLQVPTTVFVGSISERAPDVMIKRMLQHCGSVLNWKRVQGANGKLQAFGFCEYENPEGTLRCIRLLNGWQIQDKALVVKVDAKTKALLDEYKKKKRHELAKKAANDTTAFKFIYEDPDDDDEGTTTTSTSKKSNSTGDGDGKKKSGEEGEIEEEEDDYIDDDTRHEDRTLVQSLETVMREYAREMNQRALEAKEAAARDSVLPMVPNPSAMLNVSSNPSLSSNPSGPPSSMMMMNPNIVPDMSVSPNRRPNAAAAAAAADGSGVDDEEEKRALVTNEIKRFRDLFKDEDTKMRNTEKERKDRYERERALQREKNRAVESTTATSSGAANNSASSPPSRSTPPPSSSSRDRSSPMRRERDSINRRDRTSPGDDRYRSSSSRAHTSNSVRSRNDRRSSPPPRNDRRSPVSRPYNRRSRTKSPMSKNAPMDEDDDETYQRKKQERKLREKELRYRERLKAWEQRERKKHADYELEKRRELSRLHDEEKEGKRLLAFLEDYSDETEDPKYYKGTSLARRLKDREHEIEIDNRDRHREKEEIEELRQKLIIQDNVDDIELELKRRLEKDEELIRRRLADLIRTTSDESADESDNENEKLTKRSTSKHKDTMETSVIGLLADSANTSTESMDQSSNGRAHIKIQSPQAPASDLKASPRHTSALGGVPITGTKLPSKRKLAVNEAFRDDQEEDTTDALPKKSKLTAMPEHQPPTTNIQMPPVQNSPTPTPVVPQPRDEQTTRTSVSSKPATVSSGSTASASAAAAAAAAAATAAAAVAQNQEERRQAVRKLIENIPTKKEELFSFPLDWSLLDANLMEKRIKPWVTKKIVEYIGEEEPTLTDFICTSIMSKQNAESILSDIRVVLDDEAEVFVVKMWRLIVYEIEAKRHGLSK